jgi:hypothetical protein
MKEAITRAVSDINEVSQIAGISEGVQVENCNFKVMSQDIPNEIASYESTTASN